MMRKTVKIEPPSKLWGMKLLVAILGIVLIGIAMTGCTTVTVKEFDPSTGKVTKETVSKNTLAATIVSSTKDKSIFVWSSGWMVWIEVSPATPEEPTPHAKILGGNIDKGMVLLHKDQQNITGLADIIKATRSNITMSASGASSSTPK